MIAISYWIAVCDWDVYYMTNLMEYINSLSGVPVRVSSYSSYRHFLEDVGVTAKRADLLVIGEHIECDTDMDCMYITENAEKRSAENYIYKYDRISVTAKKLIARFSGNCVAEEQLMYGVYSPLGRCGKTNVAMGICNMFEGSLYVGMEEYPTLDVGDAYIRDRFMYYLLEENEELVQVVKRLPQIDVFFAMSGINRMADRDMITSDCLRWLKSITGKELAVSRVVFDLGTCMPGRDEDRIRMLDVFDRIFVPTLKDELSRRKLDIFTERLHSEYPEILQKIRLISNHPPDYRNENMRKILEEKVQ